MISMAKKHPFLTFLRAIFSLKPKQFKCQKTPFFNVFRPIFSLKPKQRDEIKSTTKSIIPINIRVF